MAGQTAGNGAVTAMKWRDEDVRAAYFCVSTVLRNCRLRGEPIPQPLRDLNDRLLAEVQAPMSRSRQELDTAGAELDSDRQIGVAEAALILGWSKRQVQRRATDLDGEIVGGRWIFQKSVVVELEGVCDASIDGGGS
jgi:hypothetical protein